MKSTAIVKQVLKTIGGIENFPEYSDRFSNLPGKTKADLLKIYEKYLINEIKSGRLDLSELRQYDYLSCWCPLGEPCHVDVLLKTLDKLNAPVKSRGRVNDSE